MNPSKMLTDYHTYLEVMEDLLKPIDGSGLDLETLRRLYESKLVYLENLRVKCFQEINKNIESDFKQDDYQLILTAIFETKRNIKRLVVLTINTNLAKRCVG